MRPFSMNPAAMYAAAPAPSSEDAVCFLVIIASVGLPVIAVGLVIVCAVCLVIIAVRFVIIAVPAFL